MNLLENPFYILGATAVSTRSDINSLAEDAALLGDPDQVAEARAILTNPRRRVEAEICWFPDIVDHEEALDLVNEGSEDPANIVEFEDSQDYAEMSCINMAVLGLEKDEDFSVQDLDDWIGNILDAYEFLDPDELLIDINAARETAGFPTVKDVEVIKEAIEKRENEVAEAIKNVFMKMSVSEAAEQLERVARYHDIPEPTPKLWLDVLSDFELRISSQLATWSKEVEALKTSVKEDGPSILLDDQLDTYASNWVDLTAPLLRSSESRGIEHEKSKGFLSAIRSICVNLHNEHHETETALTITRNIKKHFSDYDSVCKKFDEDIEQLEGLLAEQQAESDMDELIEEAKKWATQAISAQCNAALDTDSQLKQIKKTALEQARIGLQHARLSQSLGDAFDDLFASSLLSACIDFANSHELKPKQFEALIHLTHYAKAVAKDDVIKERVQTNLGILIQNYEIYKEQHRFRIPAWVWTWGIIILLALIFD